MAAANTKFEPPILDLSVDRYSAYRAWFDRWTDYSIVTKLKDESAEYRCSMLRYTFTEETRKIYNTLNLNADEAKDDKVIIEKLEAFAKGTINETLERHTFNSRSQEEGECFDDFLTELKVLLKNCNFCANCVDGLLRDRIVSGIRDSSLRQKLLSDTDLTLKKAEDACRAKEKAVQGARMLGNNRNNENPDNNADVDELSRRYGRMRQPSFQPQRERGRSSRRGSVRGRFEGPASRSEGPPCKFCTNVHQWGKQFCPGWDKTCEACGLKNHTKESKICKKKVNVRNLNQDSEVQENDNVDYLFLGQVELEAETSADESEEEYYSCAEEIEEKDNDNEEVEQKVTEIRKKKKAGRKRGKRKASRRTAVVNEEEEQQSEMSEEEEEEKEIDAMVCPLADTGDNASNTSEGVSWEVHVPAKNGEIQFKIDTGADVTVIPDEDLRKLGFSWSDIRKTKKKLYGPGKQRLRCLGYIIVNFTWGDITDRQIIYVCRGIKRALLGKPAIRRFNIVQLNIPDSYSCADVSEIVNEADHHKENIITPEYSLLKDYPQLYNKLGKINVGEDVNIKIKEGTVPHQTYSPRHIPIPQMGKVVNELKKMVELGVIRKIDKPTDWCHPIVIVNKPNGDIRLCIDLTKLNAGVERELYHLESVEETLAKLGDECVHMTKVDANSGYWQVPLDEESQELTTFITPIGRFCCTRGPYGLSSMQEIFGKKMDVVIEGLVEVAKSTDDFLVYGKTKEILRQRTRKLFDRFVKYGVTINLKKCLFEQTEMEFLGHHITAEGIRPLTSRMAAIQEFPQPNDIKQLRRFMGMANQMAKFNPDLAEASAPLRSLMSVKNHWLWTAQHTKAFNDVKEVILSPQTLKLYEVTRPTKLRVDGSRLNGVSAILYQQHGENWHPVTCASQYLKPAEQNYYPIENEMLAVTWGCKKMNMYLHGLPHFLVETDHKPLVPILNTKQIVEMSPRIQDMRMKLLKYTFTAHHVPGAKMEDADALSRAPHQQPTADDTLDEDVLCHVKAVIEQMPASTPYLEKVKKATEKDATHQQLLTTMKNNWPKSKQQCPLNIQPFWDSRHDLTMIDGLLLKGCRIVIPKSLQADILDKLHSAHQGMDRTKRRARQSCYWPGMNDQIEKMVKRCTECLRHKPSKKKEELQPHPVPTQPWQKIGSDLFELQRKNFIVITDYYSSWPEVYELKHANSKHVITVMKDVFARHGVPTELISDNGSQYKSGLFKKFAKDWDFRHTTSSPRYPQSNGLAESSVKTVKKMMKKCMASGKDIQQGLLTIRNTPLACGASPAELLMNRQLNDNLPRIPTSISTNQPKSRDLLAERSTQKQHHDRKLLSRPEVDTFRPGQRVALQDPKSKEWSIRGQIVKEVAPRSFAVLVPGRVEPLRRNRSQLRKLHSTTSTNVQQQHRPQQQQHQFQQQQQQQQQQPHEQHQYPHHVTSTNEHFDDSDEVSDTDTIPYDEEDAYDSLPEEQQSTNKTTRYGRTVRPKKPMDYQEI